jgi:hypothetical protein
MNGWVVTWLIFRFVRWFCWIGLFLYWLHFMLYRGSHIDAYGHLFLWSEMMLFGLAQAAIFAGFLELMMREKAGIPRPTLSNWMPITRARART